MRGGAIRARYAMCPTPRAPISTTRNRVSAVTRHTVSGTPTSELYEPTGATVGPATARTVPRRSFVLVLPEEPVMPTTASPGRAATTPRASSREGLLGVRDDDARDAVDRSVDECRDRPALDGRRDEVVPVGVLADPGDEEPARPGLARVGDDRTVDDHRRRVDPGRGDDRAAGEPRHLRDRQGDHAGTSRAARRIACASSARSSNGWTTPPTSWPLSWPLPTTATVASGPCAHTAATAARIASRRSPTTSTSSAAPGGPDRLHALEHRRPDRRGVLGAGVVVGDDDEVGHLGRGRAHGVPLVPVAVAPGARDAHEAARGGGPQGVHRRPDRLGGVGVVDEGPGGADPVGPRDASIRPGTRGSARTALGDRPGILAEQHERGGGHRGVGDVEGARQARPQVEVDPRGPQAEAGRVVGVDRDHPVRVASGADRRDGDAGPLHQASPPVVVDADEPLPGPLGREERCLGREVVLHVGVEVEVVAGQVGEEGDVVDHPVDAVLHEGVAGHLHDAHVEAALGHDGQQRVQLGSLRRRAHAAEPLVAEAGLHGADEPRPASERPQRRVDEVGGRRLAVRARDAHEAQRQPLGAEHPGRQGTEHLARAVDDEQRHGRPRLRDALGARRVGEDGQRAGVGCGGREVGPVGPSARQRGVEVARDHRAGVEGHARDLDVGPGVGRPDEAGEVADRSAAQLRRARNGHVDRPYRPARRCPLRRTVGSDSAFSEDTLKVTLVALRPVGGIFSSCRAYVVTSLKTGPGDVAPEEGVGGLLDDDGDDDLRVVGGGVADEARGAAAVAAHAGRRSSRRCRSCRRPGSPGSAPPRPCPRG